MRRESSHKIGGWTVNPDTNTATRGEELVRLEPRVMDLLMFFARHPGEVLSRDIILQNVWPHAYVSDSVLQSAVSTLRKAFGDSARDARFLETIPKRGYRLLASSTAHRPVIAVFPFENLTGDSSQTWLADGVSDGLTDSLGTFPEFKIISRSSVVTLRTAATLPAELARTLDVDFVVEGTITQTTSQLILRVRLVEARDNSYLSSWTESINLDELFATHHRLSRNIAGFLLQEPDAADQPETAQEVVPETVEDYLRGRYYWCKLDFTYFPRALECFQAAVKRSPDFAPAYAGIADVWGAYGYWGITSGTEAKPMVKNAIDKAKACDPRNPEVIAMEGAYNFHFMRSWNKARQLISESLRINPSYVHGHLLLALLEGTLGNPSALDAIARARRLDPLNPPTAFAQIMCLCGQGLYDDAAQYLDRLLDLHPEFPPGLEIRADLLWLQRAPDAFLAESRVWEGDPEIRTVLQSQRHDPSVLSTAARELQNRSTYTSPRIIARLLSLGGKVEEALDLLISADNRDDLVQIDFVAMNPSFAAVRKHPRYKQFSKQVGLI